MDEPEQLLPTHAFAQWAERAPQAIAIRWRQQTWCYRTLSERSCAIARLLISLGLQRGDVVAVTGDPSFGIIAALLAVLQSGGILLPLDPRLPLRRRQVMLHEAHAVFMLSVGQDWADGPIARIAIDPATGACPERPEDSTPELPHPEPGDPAYVFFTSGSTGTPKGILGCHKSLAHFLNWERDALAIGPEDHIAQLTAFSFDPVLRDVFLPLSSGAVLCLPDRAVAAGGTSDFARWMASEAISVLHTVPSLAESFLDAIDDPVALPDLRWVVFAGEPLQSSLVKRWREAFPGTYQVINLYGPTETTLAKLHFLVSDPPAPGVQPIGRPLPQTQALLLNEEGEICADGEAGQIAIRTPFRTLGYLHAPAEHSQRFTRNPFRNDELDLLFNTGDRGRYRDDGNLEFLGRLDDTVKIHGIRVDPSEVMDVLGQHPEVRYCFVFAKSDVLTAFVVCRKGSGTTAAELRLYLADRLPAAKVPGRIAFVERLPLQPNGKVDRVALLAAGESGPVLPHVFAPPRNATERTLAAIWGSLFHRDQIGVHDDFFELGGHSLMAMRVLARVRSSLGAELEVLDFFAAPTIARMAELIAQRHTRPAMAPAPAVAPERWRPAGSGTQSLSSQQNPVCPRQCVHQLFEKQVEERPDAVALVHQDRRISYRELNRLANGVARELLRRNLAADEIVALCVDRSPEMVAGMLGILKAGAAYLPLDPAYPPQRLALLLADSSARVLITQSALLKRFPQWSGMTLIAGDIPGCDEDAPRVTATPESLAYLMYTSGSTGTPKGVEIPHRGVVRLLFGNDYARFGPNRVFLQMAPMAFDASTFEIWGALLHGGACVLYPENMPIPSNLGAALRSERVTTLWLTSSLFNALIDDDPAVLRTVEQLLVGGEALSVPHVARALELLPDTEIINGYGPTECTTFACCYRIPRQWEKFPDSIPIGRPIARTEIYIMNEQLAEAPAGQAGELYIGGDGLARGYRNRPELNATAFVPNPLRNDGSRLFKTGDMARYLPDGNIEFLGRIDDQVKIRGFRIEPGEIEAVLARHPAVAQTAVRVFERELGDKHLAGYVVLHDGRHATAADLRAFLSERLPAYMIPSWFQLLSRMPLTANGKLDKRALPLPDGARASASPGLRSAQTPRLCRISFSQETLWLHDRLYPGTSAYHVSKTVELRGRLDRGALAGALNAILERHPVLRTTFVPVGGVPMQAVSPAREYPLRELDLTSNRGGYTAALREETGRAFNLASDLMLRALLVRLADELHVLVLTVHHIAFDGWSLSILFRELSQLYSALAQGITPRLPELPMQYTDYAEGERDRLRSGAMDSALLYWQRQLHGAETLRLPLDHPSAPGGPLRGATFETQIERELLFRLERLARQEDGTLFIVLLAAFQALLLRSTGQEDILLGTLVANRLRPETEGLIGFFSNTLIVRSRVRDGSSFRELLATVREIVLDAYARQDVPFAKLVEILQPAGTPYQGPPIQAVFVLQNTPAEELRLAGLQARVTSPDNETAKFALTVSVEPQGDQLTVQTEYDTGLFEASTIGKLMASYHALLEAIAGNPSQAIASVALPELPRSRPPDSGEAHRKQAGEPATRETKVDDRIEVRLTRMWRDILGVRSAGADDNFFELGGHSLLAARLIGQIQKEFDIKLSLSTLFQAPTVSQLAALIRSGSAPTQPDVIPIQPAGCRPPFHCLGAGPMFYSLANLLGPDQPFLGVPPPDGAALPTPYRLEDYAAAQVQSIRRIQADGPYCLGGWSASALAAYETARQLRAQGQEVSLLVIFDGVNPAAYQDLARSERLRDRMFRIAVRVRFHVSNLVHGGVGNVLPYLRDRWQSLRLLSRIHIWSASYRVHQRLGRPLPQWMRDQEDILIQCFYQYRPEPYPGRVLLFRHGSRPTGTPGDPLLGWDGLLTGQFEACEVLGNHREIFEEPNVRVMAEKLSQSLLDVQASCRTDPAGSGAAQGWI
jgi:amino acid adenylation domain-containing protein